jgi:DNA-binding NtrC family response regulator
MSGFNFGRMRTPGPDYDPKRPPRTLAEILAVHERIVIIQTIQLNNGSRKMAADALGISRNHLWRRMKALKIDLKAIPRTSPGRPKKQSV